MLFGRRLLQIMIYIAASDSAGISAIYAVANGPSKVCARSKEYLDRGFLEWVELE
jgi:hypothetical protein